MPQAITKIIDIGRSYIPMDPQSFPESMHSTDREDTPEERIPAIVYDGYNFMPTSYGYMSYFGTNSELDINALESRCDDVFIVQTPDLRNILIALCEDGIWIKYAGTTGSWEQVIVLTIPPDGEHKNWTKCVIGNEVYLYRAGEAHIWVCRAAENFIPAEQTPNHLNMAAQQGIFKAGGRLGFWDSANSTAWSNPDDKTDFVPALETGAGAAIFQQIVGKIVNVLQHGNGFVIYCTRSIVSVRRGADAFNFWISEGIFNENGISYLHEVCLGQPDTTHFAYTTFGFVKITDGKADYIIPEIFTFMKEKRQPVYLKLLEGRYLFFQFIDPSFVTGIPNFSHEIVPGSTLTFQKAFQLITGPQQITVCKSMRAVERQFEDAYLFGASGYTSKNQASTPGEVPIWQDNLSSVIPFNAIEAFKEFKNIQLVGSWFFDQLLAGLPDTPFTDGPILRIDAPNPAAPPFPVDYANYIYTIPGIDAGIIRHKKADPGTFTQETHEEPNEKSFFHKQEMLWHWQEIMFDAWLKAIREKEHEVFGGNGIATFTSSLITEQGSLQSKVKQEFGPYIDPRIENLFNKTYGWSDKTAWMQHNIVKGIMIENETQLYNGPDIGAIELGWGVAAFFAQDLPGAFIWPEYANYADLIATVVADVKAAVELQGYTGVIIDTAENSNTQPLINRSFVLGIATTESTGNSTLVYYPKLVGGGLLTSANKPYYLAAGAPVYSLSGQEQIRWIMLLSESISFEYHTYEQAFQDLNAGGTELMNKFIELGPAFTYVFVSWEDALLITDLPALSGPGDTAHRVLKVNYTQNGNPQIAYLVPAFPNTAFNSIDQFPTEYDIQEVTQLLVGGGTGNTVVYFRDTSTVGQPVYINKRNQIQKIVFLAFKPVEFDTCVFKEIGYTSIEGHGHYTLLGAFIEDDATPEAPDFIDICVTNPKKKKGSALANGIDIPNQPFVCGQFVQEILLNGQVYNYAAEELTLPPGSFLMQDGSIEPIYPTFFGAFVYDLQYKKWGKMAIPHKLLLNYSPINSQAGDQPVPYDIFNVNAGCLLDTGKIAIFDRFPVDSVLRLGKIGYFRKGFTDAEEVSIQFREPATGNITIEGSLDGKNIETAITQISSFTNTNEHVAKFSNSAHWFNVVIDGNYNIKNLDFLGHRKGYR